MSQLAFRSATNGGDNSFSNNSIAAPVPSGTALGDLMIVFISAGMIAPLAAPTITTPTGWTAQGSSPQSIAGGVVNIRLYCFTKIATASEASTTFTASGNSAFGYVRLSYQNPDPSTPFGQVTFGQGASSTTATLTGITTTRDNALIATFLSQGVAQTATPPGTMTERSDSATDGAEVADEQRPTAGATGNRVFTLPTAADYAWMFAEFWSRTDGAAAITLGALTTSATGTVKLQASAAITLGALTTAATAVTPVQGSASITLGALTTTATGTVGSSITGQADILLGALTTSATGAVKVQGAADITLGALTTTAAAATPVQGSAAITLGELTTAATGTIADGGRTGSANIVLGEMTTTAAGVVSGTPTQVLGGGGLAAHDIAVQEGRDRQARLEAQADRLTQQMERQAEAAEHAALQARLRARRIAETELARPRGRATAIPVRMAEAHARQLEAAAEQQAARAVEASRLRQRIAEVEYQSDLESIRQQLRQVAARLLLEAVL